MESSIEAVPIVLHCVVLAEH